MKWFEIEVLAKAALAASQSDAWGYELDKFNHLATPRTVLELIKIIATLDDKLCSIALICVKDSHV